MLNRQSKHALVGFSCYTMEFSFESFHVMPARVHFTDAG
jgi:hypothetical protein